MKTLILLCSLFICACSVAPINTVTTARPLGKDNNQGTFGVVPTGLIYTRGVTEKIDLSLGAEIQIGLMFSVLAKINVKDGGENGLSIAPLFGAGYGADLGNTKSLFSGLVLSYRKDSFEPFLTGRVNWVSWKVDELTGSNRDDLIKIPSYKKTFYYGQADVGFNYITQKAHIALGVHGFLFPENQAYAPFFDVGYRF